MTRKQAKETLRKLGIDEDTIAIFDNTGKAKSKDSRTLLPEVNYKD